MGKKKTPETKSKPSSLSRLVQAADEGDEKALLQLEEQAPEVIRKLVQRLGNLRELVQENIIHLMSGPKLLTKRGIEQQVEELRAELSGPRSSMLETLLIDRIISSWLLVNYAEAKYVENMSERTWTADEYLQKRQDRAQKRFLQACKALAQVRKLLGVNVQINIAEKQINLMNR